jgi:hypothetical protein
MSAQETQTGFRGALKSKGFGRLLAGQAVSSLGDWVATFAFIVAAFPAALPPDLLPAPIEDRSRDRG